MHSDLVLPAFEMDCRDWVVVTPPEVGLPDEVAGTPLLFVLSTAVLDDDEFRSASAVLTVGLMDEEMPTEQTSGRVASEIVEPGHDASSKCYLLPVPHGQLALLAEFTMSSGPDVELERRIEALMDSFRWAA